MRFVPKVQVSGRDRDLEARPARSWSRTSFPIMFSSTRSESEVAPGQAGDGAAESDGGTGASCVRSGHGDDQLRPARRLQTGLREPRQLGQSERRRLVEGVRAGEPAHRSHGGRQPPQTAGQKVFAGGQKAPVRPGSGHRCARDSADDRPRGDVSLHG